MRIIANRCKLSITFAHGSIFKPEKKRGIDSATVFLKIRMVYNRTLLQIDTVISTETFEVWPEVEKKNDLKKNTNNPDILRTVPFETQNIRGYILP